MVKLKPEIRLDVGEEVGDDDAIQRANRLAVT